MSAPTAAEVMKYTICPICKARPNRPCWEWIYKHGRFVERDRKFLHGERRLTYLQRRRRGKR